MDILNFISWIKGGRVVTSVDPTQTLLPVGLKDNRRDDGYLAGAITVADFAAQLAPVPAYKVYTALLTQSGFGNTIGISSGPLTKGVTYQIQNPGGNFLNVGAPNNDPGTYFVAINNDTPISYGGSALLFNTGAPVVTVLENTIGNIIWNYDSAGVYYGVLVGAFTDNKTWLSGPFGSQQTIYGVPALNEDLTNNGRFVIVTREDSDKVRITTLLQPEDIDNDVLDNFPIEIRVYS
jgi:hypothetical protein